MACNKYGLMTFVTQSVSTNEHFTWAWPKWNDLWPILPKSTFLKTYPIPMGHDTKTVIYLNYIFRFGLGLRWVISFSVSCFSLFLWFVYLSMIGLQSDFLIFSSEINLSKNMNGKKVVVDWPNDKMTHLIYDSFS